MYGAAENRSKGGRAMDTIKGVLKWLAFTSKMEDVMRWGKYFWWYFLYVALVFLASSKALPMLLEVFNSLGFLALMSVILPVAAVISYRLSIDDRVVAKWECEQEKERAVYSGFWECIRRYGKPADSKVYTTPVGSVVIYRMPDKFGEHLELIPVDEQKVDIEEWKKFQIDFQRRVNNASVSALEEWKRALES